MIIYNLPTFLVIFVFFQLFNHSIAEKWSNCAKSGNRKARIGQCNSVGYRNGCSIIIVRDCGMSRNASTSRALTNPVYWQALCTDKSRVLTSLVHWQVLCNDKSRVLTSPVYWQAPCTDKPDCPKRLSGHCLEYGAFICSILCNTLIGGFLCRFGLQTIVYSSLLWWSDHRKRKHHQSSLVGNYYTQWLVILALGNIKLSK